MNTRLQAVALENKEEGRDESSHMQSVLGIVGRILLLGAGLALGALLGLIAGLYFGLIQFAC